MRKHPEFQIGCVCNHSRVPLNKAYFLAQYWRVNIDWCISVLIVYNWNIVEHRVKLQLSRRKVLIEQYQLWYFITIIYLNTRQSGYSWYKSQSIWKSPKLFFLTGKKSSQLVHLNHLIRIYTGCKKRLTSQWKRK